MKKEPLQPDSQSATPTVRLSISTRSTRSFNELKRRGDLCE
ncbi:unnamed protein product, partial [Dibothriocephalus latus]